MGIWLILLSALVLLGAVLVGGVHRVKLIDAKRKDHDRVPYILTFPAQMDYKDVVKWLGSISSAIKTAKLNVGGSETVVVELVARDGQYEHRLWVPWQKRAFIISQLLTLIPGMVATPVEDGLPPVKWTWADELGESRKSHTLRITEPDTVAHSILSASSTDWREGEVVMMQWVIAPAIREQIPTRSTKTDRFSYRRLAAGALVNDDELRERRDKLSEPNFLGVLRIAAKAKTDVRAKYLVENVKNIISVTDNPPNYWTRSTNKQSVLIDRVTCGSSLINWPAQVTASELGALIAWPIGEPNVSGLPRGASKRLPASC